VYQLSKATQRERIRASIRGVFTSKSKTRLMGAEYLAKEVGVFHGSSSLEADLLEYVDQLDEKEVEPLLRWFIALAKKEGAPDPLPALTPYQFDLV